MWIPMSLLVGLFVYVVVIRPLVFRAADVVGDVRTERFKAKLEEDQKAFKARMAVFHEQAEQVKRQRAAALRAEQERAYLQRLAEDRAADKAYAEEKARNDPQLKLKLF